MMVRLLGAVAIAFTGCSSARYVHRGADGGVVAIPAPTNHWPSYHRDEATRLIAAHVGPGYEVQEEWEVTTGQAVHHDQQADRQPIADPKRPFLPAERVTARTTTTVSDLTEWRIRYRRKPTSPADPGPQAPAP